MSDPENHPSLPPDFGKLPGEPASGPPPEIAPITSEAAPVESQAAASAQGPPTPPTSGPGFKSCSACGAPYPAFESDTLCPKCRQILGAPALPPAGPDAPAFVVSGQRCLSCGYDLSGLSSDSLCPECGTPVARSLQGDLLRFSSPEYVKTLATGALVAEVASIVAVVASFIPFGGAMVVTKLGFSTRAQTLTSAVLQIALSGASLAGWWMLSTPDPARLSRDEAIGARKLLRFALGAECAVMLVKLAMVLLPTTTVGLGLPSPSSGGAGSAGAVLLAAAVGLFVVGVYVLRFFSSMAYLRSVAKRFPDMNLYKRASTFMWLGPVLAVCSIVTCFISLAVAYVFYLVNLDHARRLLRDTLQTMKALAAGATAPVS